MKKVLGYFIDYQRKYFDWKVYASFIVFMVICIALNYHYDFEDGVIDTYSGQPIKWVWMFLFHGLPYLVICFILSIFGQTSIWLKSRSFWISFFIGFGLLALDRSFYGFDFIAAQLPARQIRFVMSCIGWSSSLILVVIPLLLVYPLLEKDGSLNYYGLGWKKFDPKPYLILLGIASVFIFIGSFTAEIQNFYPKYHRSGYQLFMSDTGWPEWLVATIYEICYGSNFISVELVFRGFLIFAFTRTLGPHAVLPMVATYAFLHFGKPLGESISSIIGGYVLGIISLNSRNIWGGIFIHLGVAWFMELLGWLHSKF